MVACAVVHPKMCYKGRYSMPAPLLDIDGLRTGTLSDLIEDVFDRYGCLCVCVCVCVCMIYCVCIHSEI